MDKKAESIYEKISEGIEELKRENGALLSKLRRNKLQVLKLLIKIVEEIDPYTKGHSIKVYRHVVRIAKQLRLSKREIDVIGRAALLHDVGKIVIDKKILNKKGRLTSEEFAVIKAHPAVGADIVQGVEHLKDSCEHILYHHTMYDGGGYPQHKLKHDEIPLGARLIAVADSFDAMTSDRPYRKAFTKEYAIEELKKCAGRQYDPRIVNIFIEILENGNNHNNI